LAHIHTDTLWVPTMPLVGMPRRSTLASDSTAAMGCLNFSAYQLILIPLPATACLLWPAHTIVAFLLSEHLPTASLACLMACTEIFGSTTARTGPRAAMWPVSSTSPSLMKSVTRATWGLRSDGLLDLSGVERSVALSTLLLTKSAILFLYRVVVNTAFKDSGARAAMPI